MALRGFRGTMVREKRLLVREKSGNFIKEMFEGWSCCISN